MDNDRSSARKILRHLYLLLCLLQSNTICRSNGDITIRLSYDEDNYEYYNVVSYIDLINKRKNKSVNDQKVYNDL